jgi:hypothetical protein
MTWFVLVYLLAGGTIARMAWESDSFADPDFARQPPERQAQLRRADLIACWVIVFVWPIVPALLVWSYVRIPRR